ncbi:MAG: hypothetical protein AB1746_10355, partial [Candidatus Zixiibacteriota bacterium]
IYDFIGGKSDIPANSSRPVAKIESARTEIKPENIDIEKYTALEWGRDPFYHGQEQAKPHVATANSPVWTLGGILYDINSPSAIINKKIVRDGDIINGARVVQIEKESVILDKDGLQFTLTIAKEKS